MGLDKDVPRPAEVAHEALAAGGAFEEALQQPAAGGCKACGEMHPVLPRQDVAVVYPPDLALRS